MPRIYLVLAGAGAIVLAIALVLAPSQAHSAIDQAWPPFALVAGLLLIGAVAADDGLFEMAGAQIARLPGGVAWLFVASMTLVTVVTVLLTLDTSVVFLTPILIHMARRRGVSDAPFVYGCVFMSNSASLLLPGSNLTNLIVLSTRGVSGGHFAAEMLPAWIAAVVVTGVVTAVMLGLQAQPNHEAPGPSVPRGLGLGAIAATIAVIVVLVVPSPALVVLILGIITAAIHGIPKRSPTLIRALNAPLLGGLFGVMVGLGAVARAWGGPARLMDSADHILSAALGAGTSVAINNLPAAVLLASGTPAHARALLIGLNIGPNLAVTGSLSAIFWMQVARSTGAGVSASRYSRVGVILAPIAIAAALAATALLAPGSL